MDQQSIPGAPFEPGMKPTPTSPTTSEFATKTCPTGSDALSPSPAPLAQLPQQLAHSLSSPIEAQNRPLVLASSTLADLPEEILIDIFFLLINHAGLGSPLERPFDKTVHSAYKQLFILIGVCSGWRRICLSRGAFWSLISARKHWKVPESIIDLCLERVKDSDLHLDAELYDAPNDRLLEIITKYGPRVRTLNLSGETPEALRNTVSSLLEQSRPGFIPSLFLRNDQVTLDNDSHHTWPLLFPLASPEHTLFAGFADSLSALRLRGFNLGWRHTEFSKLVELKLHHICFHKLSEIADLMHAIASAPILRRLQLIDLRCHLDDVHTLQIDQHGNFPPLHPTLQFLFLKNIRWGLLLLILRSIIPGSYKTVVSYSRKIFLERYSTDLTLLKESVLQSFNIDTLMVSRNWVQYSDFIPCLLRAMPTIKGLCIAHCEFTEKTFKGLTCPLSPSTDGGNAGPATIRRLHILGSTFELSDLEGLKEVVTSHGIQELKLGGSVDRLKSDPEHIPTLEHPIRFEDPNDDEHTAPIKEWLRSAVPKFDLVERLEDLPDIDFQSYDW
ncbi:hypothetical protein B0J17DRAFT_710219 [Rhizoctonia solani]|nr:hypothetical protein B0J17DRAFT_710219 [Rhizoctonia solani]